MPGGGPAVVAQQMEHSAPSIPSTHLTIKTYEGKTLTFSPEELAALPHKTVAVFNAHSKANETLLGCAARRSFGQSRCATG